MAPPLKAENPIGILFPKRERVRGLPHRKQAENGSDTLCKKLVLGMIATGDVQPKENLVDVFPNPSDGRFLLTIRGMYLSREYSGSMTHWAVRVHHQRVYYGWK